MLRVFPQVAVSPDGRYLLAAGGYGGDGGSGVGQSVEIYDREAGKWINVQSRFPGLDKLPNARFGGSATWLQDPDGTNRIVFAGGSKRYEGLENSTPMLEVDVYSDCGDAQQQSKKQGSWRTTELVTPRMLPAMAARWLDNGDYDVVIAGGGTGRVPGARIDPQLYSVELLNPRTGDVSMGRHVPEQKGFVISGRTAVEWSSNALIFDIGLSEPKQCAGAHASKTGYLFGFSAAYKGTLGAPIDGI